MAILVSDSSVLFDLERGGLLESAFSCGLPMVVPDLLFENELRDYNGAYFQELGLAVTALNPDECRGLLWLLDEMFATGKVSANQLCESLTRIKQDKRCRLPKSELDSRIKRWCGRGA